MIVLQRKLVLQINDYCKTKEKLPPYVDAEQFYPVVGYSVQMRKREERKEHEEIEAYYFINDRGETAFIYASYCKVSLDPLDEPIANSEVVKGKNGAAKGAK